MLSPEGAMLNNETVCEIILSCFRICFEPRLTGIYKITLLSGKMNILW